VLQADLRPEQGAYFKACEQNGDKYRRGQTELNRTGAACVANEREWFHCMRTVDCALNTKLLGIKG